MGHFSYSGTYIIKLGWFSCFFSHFCEQFKRTNRHIWRMKRDKVGRGMERGRERKKEVLWAIEVHWNRLLKMNSGKCKYCSQMNQAILQRSCSLPLIIFRGSSISLYTAVFYLINGVLYVYCKVVLSLISTLLSIISF